MVYLNCTEFKGSVSHKIVCSEGSVTIFEKTSNSFLSNKTEGTIIPEYPVEIESAMPNKLQKGYIFKKTYSLDNLEYKYVNHNTTYGTKTQVNNQNNITYIWKTKNW